MRARAAERQVAIAQSDILWAVEEETGGTKKLSLYKGKTCTTLRLNPALSDMLRQMLKAGHQ